MLISMLKSKLHGATVTGCALDYEGSITVDSTLMKAVKLLPHEKVLVANLRNGNRFETYAIPAPAGSGEVCLNGAAALLGKPGDRVILLSFALMSPRSAARHEPNVVVLDGHNRPAKRKAVHSK